MESKELRKGNIVHFTSSLVYVTISSLGHKNLHIEESVDTIYYNEVFGVVLTPDILFRCGFIKSSCHQTLQVFNLPETQIQVIIHDQKMNFRLVGFTICEVQYLHHLQNLVFDINKGAELSFAFIPKTPTK